MSSNDLYTGYSRLLLSDQDLADFYEGKKQYDYFMENEYLILDFEECPNPQLYCYQDGKFRKTIWEKLHNEYTGTLVPRNEGQRLVFDMLQDKSTTVKVVTGPYGSGKTLLMVNHALSLIERNKFEKIVWVRNNIEVKDSVPLGTLPGEAFDKLLPYAMPLADHVGGIEGIKYLMDKNRLEIQHLGFLRGRDIKNSIIISSEAENLTKEHVQLLIGRVGEGSQLWLDGDLKQTDKEVFNKNNGLRTCIERLKGNRLFSYVHLTKSERSETARLADLLDKSE